MLYLELFLNFMLIGAMSFGGGYGTLSLIENIAVEKCGWITHVQLYDLITLSEVTPGPIALNAASFTGYTVGGFIGSVVATVGCVLPSCVFMSLITYIYTKYRKNGAVVSVVDSVKPAVCSLVFAAFLTVFLPVCFGVASPAELISGKVNAAALLIFSCAIVLCRTKRVSTVFVILLSGLGGAVLT